MMKPKRPGFGGEGIGSESPSKNLFVGNLPPDVTESYLMELFGKHGLLDRITCYASRTYAFVCYMRVEDAIAAMLVLQGFLIKGNPIKIEFAKPAKPSKHVWVGGFGSSVTKEKLEEELSKFGKIEEFKFIRDRNIALVDFVRPEDASAAVKNLNGLQIGADHVRVDFLRSNPTRREQADFHELGGAQFRGMGGIDPSWSNPDIMRNHPEPNYLEHKRPPPSQSFGGRQEGQPSKVLWVGYPPSVIIDEGMLHNAMILYGEIEAIKCFPARHYSFVEFRSVEEARRAKEALQGRIFNDPCISIMFSNIDLAPDKDFGPPYHGFRGHGADVFGTEVPFRPPLMDVFPPNRSTASNGFSGLPAPLMDVFPPNRGVAPNGFSGLPAPLMDVFPPNRGVAPIGFSGLPAPLMDVFPPTRGVAPNGFPGLPASNGLLGSGVPRPFDPRGSLEQLLWSSDFKGHISDLTTHTPLTLNRTKLSPPATGLLPTLGVSGRASHMNKRSGWDVLDTNQLPRESKKSRVDDLGLFNNHFLPIGKRNECIGDLEQPYGASPQFISRPLPKAVPDSGFSPADTGVAKGLPPADEECIWRGVIAKGGTPVCHARCIPIGKGLECALSEVVDCSARTGLDMLTKHCAGAIGFDIIFFLPDSEDDFVNYTEFLRFLGSKNRAGVAKLDDGTTLFLVPPSGFLTDVLKVASQERLYGVVLKLAQQLPGGGSAPLRLQQPLPPIQHMENQLAPAREYVVSVLKKEPAIQTDYFRAGPAETSFPRTASNPLGSVSQHQSNDSIPSTSRPGVTLTPELIATLATLLPANAQAQAGPSAQPQLNCSAIVASVPVPTNVKGVLSQGWSQHPQVPDQTGQSSQQFNSQLYSNAQASATFQPSSVNLSSSSHPGPVLHESMPIQNPMYSLQEQGPVSSRASSIHLVKPQDQQFIPSIQGMQPNNSDNANNTHNAYGMVHGIHAGSYGVADTQQLKHSNSYANQFHGANLSHPENILPNSSENVNVKPLNQAERVQVVPSEVDQVAAEVEVDKNKRYQSTLQFAANLLFQIQQKQQQQQAGFPMGNQQ